MAVLKPSNQDNTTLMNNQSTPSIQTQSYNSEKQPTQIQ